MSVKLSLALAQLNPAVGDIVGNLAKLRAARKTAADLRAHLLVTPELFLSGYPPEDLVLKPSFQNALQNATEELARETADGGPAILLGVPWREQGRLYNAVLLLNNGTIAAKVFKRDLPNYGPFDEKRVFAAGPLPEPVLFHGVKLGVVICEDLWTSACAVHVKSKGAQLIVSPNGSPYESDKENERQNLARRRVKETGLPLIYLNQICGQDELVFDGGSFVMDAQGSHILRMKSWVEDIALWSFTPAQKIGTNDNSLKNTSYVQGDVDRRAGGNDRSREAAIYNALILGLRDYVHKNKFPGVVLGLSGGIDSALVAAVTVDALGADKVWSVMMPSPYTSDESHEDARATAEALGCRYDTISISMAMDAFGATLKPAFGDKPSDTTEENIQARCRGLILMALSNKFGPMVISSGNKSEVSVGYSTLYGDLCGGFALIKDVYKTQVYKIVQWRNVHKPETGLGPRGAIIPERILTKAPTAELHPGQADQDSLPPYDVLDNILEGLIEKDLGLQDIVAQGHDEVLVKRIWSMLDRAEYKRRQAPPGVKITRRNLGKDRRYPITNGYRE